MNKKIVSCLLVLATATSTVLSAYQQNYNIVSAQENEAGVMFIVSNANNTPNIEVLDFEISEVGGIFKQVVKSNMGMVNVQLQNGKKYIIKLINSDKYVMEDTEFTVVDGAIIGKEGPLAQLFLNEKDEKIEFSFVLTNDDKKAPITDELDFEFTEVGGSFKESAKSENGFVMISLENNKSYMSKLVKNDKFTMEDVEFSVADGSATSKDGARLIQFFLKEKKAENNENNGNEAVKLDALTVNVVELVDSKEMNLNGIKFNLFKWDGPIPNLVSRHSTDGAGKVVVNQFDANSRYEFSVADTKYKFDNGKIDFKTDKNRNIKNINGKEVTSLDEGNIKITAVKKDSNKLNALKVDFKVLDKNTMNPIPGVELTVNNVEPALKSYKRAVSGENGIVSFDLEGQKNGKIYTVTISKNQQFLWDFKPEEITFIIDENLNINYLTPKMDFLLIKNDRTHMFYDLRNLIKEGEKLLNSNFKDDKKVEKLKEELKTSIAGAKLELEKESIPYYIEGFINDLKEKIKNLKEYEVKAKEEKNIFDNILGKEEQKSENNSNWILKDDAWYLVDKDGNILNKDSWAMVGGIWYRFDKEGKMLSETWYKEDGKWYWIKSNGAMASNQWIYIKDQWYWAHESGKIAENQWIYVRGQWYFAYEGGHLAMNTTMEENGKIYKFNEKGEWVK